MKCCPKCASRKERAGFYADKSRADGLSGYCKACQKEAVAAWHRANPGVRAKFNRKWRLANPEAHLKSVREWRRANPEVVREAYARWRRANLDKGAAQSSKRHSARLRRTPPWLTQAHFAEIEGVYHFAKVMEQIAGCKYHVDHVEPLQGQDVSGLHVPWNLRVIPARDNLVKGNRRIVTNG